MCYTSLLIIESKNAKVKKQENLILLLEKYQDIISKSIEPGKLCLIIDEDGYFDFDADDWVAKWDFRKLLSFIQSIIGEGEVYVFLKDTFMGDFGYKVTPEGVYELEMQWVPIRKIEVGVNNESLD